MKEISSSVSALSYASGIRVPSGISLLFQLQNATNVNISLNVASPPTND